MTEATIENKIFINNNKKITLSFGGKKWYESAFGDKWRDYLAPAFEDSLIFVDQNIRFSSSTEYEEVLKSLFEKLKNSTPGKIASGLQKLSSFAAGVASTMTDSEENAQKQAFLKKLQIMPAGARYQTTLASMPAWKDTSKLNIGSFTFNFYLGMAGDWDGRTEVYNPALALYKVNLPSKEKGVLRGPLPPTSEVFGVVAAKVTSSVKTAAGQAFSGGNAGDDSDSGMQYQIEKALSEALTSMEEGLKTTLSTYSGAVSLTWGKFKFPLFTVKDTSIEFSKETDTNGYPIKATVTWNGCETVEMAYREQLEFALAAAAPAK